MRQIAVAGCVGLAVVGFASAQTTWYVDANGVPPGSGTVAFPYTSIQYAIARSTTIAGDTVLVRPGTYHENLNFLGKAITVKSSQGALTTVIVDAINGPDLASVVTFNTAEGSASVLDGFTLQLGDGTWSVLGVQSGGGVYIDGASPTIQDCILEYNWAAFGGGLFGSNTNVRIERCTIRANDSSSSWGQGRGLCFVNSSPTMIDCAVIDQTGYFSGRGGGAFFDSSSPTLIGCRFENNLAGDGAGAWFQACFAADISECTFSGNAAIVGHGGGVYIESSSAVFRDCAFNGNGVSEGHAGGGLYAGGGTLVFERSVFAGNGSSYGGGVAFGNSQATLLDCVISWNISEPWAGWGAGHGGGVWVSGGSVSLTNCLVTSNSARCCNQGGASGFGGGVFGPAMLDRCTVAFNDARTFGGVAGGAMLHNSIVWRNEPASSSPSTSGSWSNVEGGLSGLGNISISPAFWEPTLFDVHLLPTSPCIDTGDPASALDPDGSRADMGAYPFDPSYCIGPTTYCSAKVNSLGCVPAISTLGTASLSGPDDFVVVASNVLNQKSGMFFWGLDVAATPFGGGTKCVASPVVRSPVFNSGGSTVGQDCFASLSFPISHSYMQTHGFVAGMPVFGQWWSRDPGFSPPNAISLTEGLRFYVCP